MYVLPPEIDVEIAPVRLEIHRPVQGMCRRPLVRIAVRRGDARPVLCADGEEMLQLRRAHRQQLRARVPQRQRALRIEASVPPRRDQQIALARSDGTGKGRNVRVRPEREPREGAARQQHRRQQRVQRGNARTSP